MIAIKKGLFVLVCVAFQLVAKGQLSAQSGIFDRIGIIPGHGSYSSLPEESIDLFTGDLTLRYRDIYLPGPNGLDIEVWRVYNSKILQDRLTSQPTPTVQAYPKTMLGIGWTMHMGMVHSAGSQNAVIEFPDGRRETCYMNNYALGPFISITKDFLKYDRQNYILYFENGVKWTFGQAASIPLANGSYESVQLVTNISDYHGNSITVDYDPNDNYRSILRISDSMGRQINFDKSYQGSNPAKLTQIRFKKDATNEVTYCYSVGAFANGFYKLTSFTPPGLPAVTYEYNDGESYNYELTKVTTSYGGLLEFTYANHDFYFSTTKLDSKVVSQKKITFIPGNQATWTYAYPTYQGVTSGVVTVQGPEYTTSVTNCAYNSSCPWSIGLILGQTVSDGSFSDTLSWTYQQISNDIWSVLGINMGAAKGPLVSWTRSETKGDAILKTTYLYSTSGMNPKRYGLPSEIDYYVNDSASKRNYQQLSYFWETHTSFSDRYLLLPLASQVDYSASGTVLKETLLDYFEDGDYNRFGAIKQVKKRVSGSPSPTYLTWNWDYNGVDPKNIYVKVTGPGSIGLNQRRFAYGVETEVDAPAFTQLTRDISPYTSYVNWEKNQHGGKFAYAYDDLGRISSIALTDESGTTPPDQFYNISYTWRGNGENKVEITQGANKVTRYWDGIGRDLGYTESDGSTILYHLKELDAEGRVKYETQGSVNSSYKYSYTLDAIGRPTQIKDPVNNTTYISYNSNHVTTVRDPNGYLHNYDNIKYEYNDLPGQPTKLTDAKGKAATYTYDAAGRLITVNFNNGARNQVYVYDGVDNVTSEIHPETGTISYSYNAENRLSQKTWGGTSLNYTYNISGQLERTIGAETLYYYYDDKGRFQSVNSPSSWSRGGIEYNCWGSIKKEIISIPGLGSKTVQYAYDGNNNLVDTTYPDLKTAHAPHSGLNRPTSLSFNQTTIVNNGSVSFGPNKMIAGMGLGNGTTFSSTFYNNGMPNVVSLMLGASALYNATYAYDGAGNITGISSTAPTNPTLSATFGYDELNRLTSANYTSGRVASYTYDYDEYGNMKTVKENGGIIFNKTYDSSNRISGFSYDTRGNLTSANGKNYFWDVQNRLSYISDASGQFLGDYKYDDRGLRLYALPPQPDIDVVGCPSGQPGPDFTSSLNTPSDKTFTLQNLGHATLTLASQNPLTFSGPDAGLFSVQQQPASSIAPNQSTTFVIRFLPTSTGNKAAVLQIWSNDPDENPYTINLNGYCEPEINVVGVPTGGIYDFGTIIVGNSSTNTFTLQNLGTSNLILNGDPMLGGVNPDDFYLEQLPTSPVAALGSTTFTVRFAPNSQGAKSATLSISNNDLNENPYVINLRGTGHAGPQKVTEGSVLVLTYPNGGEELKAGTIQHISWKGGESAKALRIECSTDNGSSYQTIAARAANIGTYPWKVPADLSSACLIRISDANGAPIAPLYISYEFNFKVSVPKDAAQKATGFTFRAGMRDPKTKNYQAAEVSFVPDEVRGSENLLFNQALAELQSFDLFLNAWHHARIQYDMSNYSGSVWIDDQPVVSNVPLTVDLKVKSSAEISIQSSTDVPIKLWLDDVEVKFIDQNSPQPGIEAAAFMPVLKEHFNRYESKVFPAKGGWINVLETAEADTKTPAGTARSENREDGIKSAAAVQKGTKGASAVDESEYVSSAKSLRLENQEAAPAYVAKKISLPARIPFVVSGDNFSIVPGDAQLQSTEGSDKPLDNERGDSRDIAKEGRRNSGPSGREANASSARAGANARVAKTNMSTNSTSGNKSATKTFSASPAGGTYYIYAFDGRLLAEYNLYGLCVRDYIYFGGQLVAEYDALGDQYYYYTSDQSNSTRIVTNSTGVVVHAAAYDPYGGIQTPQGWPSAFNPTPKFSGKERDGESDLDYFGARYYNHSLYRFLSVDPIFNGRAALSNPQRWNGYAYCLGNPTNYVDPTGASPQRFTLTVQRESTDIIYGSCYGKLYANGVLIGYTLESNTTKIPAANYKGILTKMDGEWVIAISWFPKFKDTDGKIKYRVPLIMGGVYAETLHGCIYIGTNPGEQGKIVPDDKMWNDLVEQIKMSMTAMDIQTARIMNMVGSGLLLGRIGGVLSAWAALDGITDLLWIYEYMVTEIDVTIKNEH